MDCACRDSFFLTPLLSLGWQQARNEQILAFWSYVNLYVYFFSLGQKKKKKKSVYKELLVSLFSSAFPALNHSAIIKAPLEKNYKLCHRASNSTAKGRQRSPPSSCTESTTCSQHMPREVFFNCRFFYVRIPSSREAPSVLISSNRGEQNVGAPVLGLGC